MTNWTDECHQFGILRKSLRQDLVSWHGFSNQEAGQILNWFNPTSPEYLEHVDAWQRLLCGCVVESTTVPFSVVAKTSFGTYSILDAIPDQIGAIHQVAKLLYKYHGTPRRETNMQEVVYRLSEPQPIALDRSEIEGIRECLSSIRPTDLNEACGRFGPGSTAEGFTSFEKWSRIGLIPDVPPNLYRVNPRDPWVPSYDAAYEPTTKIAEVPKSIKSNRIVSSEPAMYMFAQLAVNDDIVDQIHRVFRGHVSLHDQKHHNTYLRWAGATTLDLSDASDHNQCELVRLLLPQLWPVLAKVRSTYAAVPGSPAFRLNTFAPMGSGVCFSIMTTIILGICEYARRSCLFDGEHSLWYTVYGDDVILATPMYPIVADLLERAGFVINKGKSCHNLAYVESCGVELFKGVEITPAYIRDPIASLSADKVEQVAHHLDERFFPNTAAVVAEVSDCARFLKYNRKLQRMEVCVRAISAVPKLRCLDGWSGLNRWFSVHTQGRTWGQDKDPSGAVQEVWTKPSWRLKACWDYPYLTHWLVTSASCTDNPTKKK